MYISRITLIFTKTKVHRLFFENAWSPYSIGYEFEVKLQIAPYEYLYHLLKFESFFWNLQCRLEKIEIFKFEKKFA